jgi:hypothetical protein
MREFTFTLDLTGVTELTTKRQDDLFEAGCDDALMFSRGGQVYLDFIRQAPALPEAIKTTPRAIEKAGLVSQVDQDALTI